MRTKINGVIYHTPGTIAVRFPKKAKFTDREREQFVERITGIELVSRRIMRSVARYYNFPVEKWFVKNKCQLYTEPRQVATWVISKMLPEITNRQIGDFFDLDHASIVARIKYVNGRMQVDKAFQAKVLDIYQNCKLLIGSEMQLTESENV